jgi:hypothetical protein
MFCRALQHTFIAGSERGVSVVSVEYELSVVPAVLPVCRKIAVLWGASRADEHQLPLNIVDHRRGTQ